MSQEFYDFVYYRHPVVCVSHTRDGKVVGPATISNGLWGARGLSCPICYGVARVATPDEASSLDQCWVGVDLAGEKDIAQ